MRKILLLLMVFMSLASRAQSFVWFKEPEEIYKEHVFKVSRIWSDKYALALTKGDAKRGSKEFNGNLVLLVAAEGTEFYDNQVVEVKGKTFPLVIGVFKFMVDKKKNTIPIVAIKKKEKPVPLKRNTNTTGKKSSQKKKESRTADGLIVD